MVASKLRKGKNALKENVLFVVVLIAALPRYSGLHVHFLLFCEGIPGTSTDVTDKLMESPEFKDALGEYAKSVVREEIYVPDGLRVCGSAKNGNPCQSKRFRSVQIDISPTAPLSSDAQEPELIECVECLSKFTSSEMLDQQLQRMQDHPESLETEAGIEMGHSGLNLAVANAIAVRAAQTHDFRHRPTCFSSKKKKTCRARYPREPTDAGLLLSFVTVQ